MVCNFRPEQPVTQFVKNATRSKGGFHHASFHTQPIASHTQADSEGKSGLPIARKEALSLGLEQKSTHGFVLGKHGVLALMSTANSVQNYQP
jgi:hypothetical protein